jgi:outer membrane lipoprotein-sorting protein
MRSSLTALAFCVLAMAPSLAASAKPVDDKALVGRAAAYLQGLKSAEARFSQTDPRGAVTTGTFALERPGKARFAYDPPAGLTVVADGVDIDVYDARLKTFNHYPMKQTPLALLLGSDVRFDRSAVVTSVVHDRDGFAIGLRDRTKKTQGQLTLRFTGAPMALAGWTVLDPQGGTTRVALSGLRSGVSLSPTLFELHDPNPRTFRP